MHCVNNARCTHSTGHTKPTCIPQPTLYRYTSHGPHHIVRRFMIHTEKTLYKVLWDFLFVCVCLLLFATLNISKFLSVAPESISAESHDSLHSFSRCLHSFLAIVTSLNCSRIQFLPLLFPLQPEYDRFNFDSYYL